MELAIRNNLVESLNETGLSYNLKYLMDSARISEAELSRKTEIPQPTLNRILLKTTTDPRSSTLLALSSFFEVSIEQLLGVVPLKPAVPSLEGVSYLPLLNWHQVAEVDTLLKNINAENHSHWFPCLTTENRKSFGIRLHKHSVPEFSEGSILIVDMEKQYIDGNNVIVLFGGKTPALRQIYPQGNEYYLALPNQPIPPCPLSAEDRLIGVVVEARVYFE